MKNISRKNAYFDLIFEDIPPIMQAPVVPCLKPFVKSIEIQITASKITKLTNCPYRILPDMAIVMGFQYRGHLYLLEKDTKKQLKQSGISGLQTHSRIFQTTVASPLQMAKVIQNFLIQLQRKAKPHYRLDKIEGLTKALIINPAINSIADFARQHGYTTRNLERHFKTSIGLSPKQLLRIARFQKTLQALRATAPLQAIIENCGYYDQAHLLNEFKAFSGMTPGRFSNLI